MHVSPAEYLSLRLCAHELLHDVPLYDVSVVDLPGGGAGRSVADIRSLESTAAPSRIAKAVYDMRHVLGRVFGWDRMPMQPKSRCCRRCLSATDATPKSRLASYGPFLVLYQFPGEALSETRNATVHGYICTALARTATGYRLFRGVYVRPVSWLTRPYLIVIEPFCASSYTRRCCVGLGARLACGI